MLTLTIQVATVLPEVLSCYLEPPVTMQEATDFCEAVRADQRVIPNDALVCGDVKICFEDDNGPVKQLPAVAFPATIAPETIESLLGVRADLVSLFVACGRVVAEMMLEGRSDEEIDYVLMRLERETRQSNE